MMSRITVALPMLVVAALALLAGCAATKPPPAADGRLPAPQNDDERNYLGLSTAISRFSVDEVRAEILIVDFFDMYCHVCQRQAPHLNELYALVQARGLGGRVKIIGVGVGDTPLEAATFKEKFKLAFPVFPDRFAAFTLQFGRIRVPALIVLKKQGDHFKIIHHGTGIPAKPEELLAIILSDAAQPSRRDHRDLLHTGSPSCGTQAARCVRSATDAGTTDPDTRAHSQVEPRGVKSEDSRR